MDYNITPKHNYKLSEEDRKLIVLDYTLNHTNDNIYNICSRYNISKRTLYDILHKYTPTQRQEIVNESIKSYKRNFTKRTTHLINKALDKLEQQLEQDNDSINLSQLSTTIGILYDKSRLEDNLSTSNNSFNININIDK